jgi:signal transduction histidine kinase
METVSEVNYITALLPMAAIVFIIAIGVVLLTQQFRKNLYRQQLEQEELKNIHQLELLKASILAQEEERKRIARDMHDELGATLSITRMHLMQAERQYGTGSEQIMADLNNIRQLTETSLNSMRRISHELMPPQLETFGLVKTLEATAYQLNKTGEINLELQIPTMLQDMSWVMKLSLYRIFMELINNTIKHAGATRIVIGLEADASGVRGRYSDNGKGLDTMDYSKGIGFKSLEGRVRSLGGSISVNSGAGRGFNVLIEIPQGTQDL